MEEHLDELHLAAWRALLNAHAAMIDLIEGELTATGQLSLSSYDVLLTLLEAPGQRLRMHEIANDVVLSRSGLTRRIDKLEEQGLLARERVSTDRRGSYAVLTPKGREALRGAWPIYARGIQQHFAALLSDNEVRVITEAFERIIAATRMGGRDNRNEPIS